MRKPSYAQLVAMLKELQEHLDYCGWGDSWERSCAAESKIPERLEAMLEAAEKTAVKK